MSGPFARWLFDLDTIPAGADGLRLAFEHPWPLWAWALIAVLVVTFAAWSYSRLSGPVPARAALAAARSAVLLLVLLVISGPMLELPRVTVEPDWVLLLADRSASMTIADAPSGARRISRDEQLRGAVDGAGELFTSMEAEHRLVWLGFHLGAFDLGAEGETTEGAVDLGVADGDRTDLGSAIEQALQRAAARPVSGVVVLSDGRASEPVPRSVVRRLQADQIPVFAVPLGSEEPIGDLAIRRVDAPTRAFVRDKVPVVVELDRLGGGAGIDGAVRFVDTMTGEELDRREIEAGTDEQITLIAEPKLAGDATWQVIIETDQPDLIPENNLKPFEIRLVDRPLRVLYVDGYPRWEYRFLKDVLVREESIESSVFLVSADRDFAQEGNQPITRLPRSPEEFADFDAVIIGDVPGSFFSPEQLEMIRDHVAVRGAGLLWIGGERSAPQSYVGGAGILADLLPMRPPLNLPRIEGPVNMRPTPLAGRLGVLRLALGDRVGWPRELTDPSYEWSRLYWAQRIEPGRLKPTAEVLAETSEPVRGAHLPLVVFMRYGAGQTIYVATDEVWRWRYGRGDQLPEQFWVQMIRMLGRESLAAGGQRAIMTARPRRVEVGQPVRIDVRLLDTALVDSVRGGMTAVIEDREGRAVAELDLRPAEGEEARYAATYLPDAPGTFQVRIDEGELRDLGLRASFEALDRDDELRRPETDHDLLADLAAATGGDVVGPDELDRLRGLLPNRSVRTENPLTERIWDSPLFFILLLLALTAEWVGRKVIRLA